LGLKGYEITDRGKIIVAVVLVVVILTTAVVLAVRALNGNGSPYNPEGPPQIVDPGPGDDDPHDDPNGDPINGDGPDSPYPPGTENGEQVTGDPPTEPPVDPNGETGDDPTDEPGGDAVDGPGDGPVQIPPEVGPVSINRTEGTMSFMFAPSVQNTLDSNSSLMLKEFIDSPMNTQDTQLVVEMPHLSESEVTTLIRAITSAFSEYGVAQRDITFLVYQPDTTSDSIVYEVRMSFRQSSTEPGTGTATGPGVK